VSYSTARRRRLACFQAASNWTVPDLVDNRS
jgi:hypothetical protein